MLICSQGESRTETEVCDEPLPTSSLGALE